jgi:GH15 family glucan-1,4-alpha-glucosidase
MSAVKDKLWVKTEVGGVARYINDYYHQISNDIENVPGNPWFICTLWLAEWYIKRAQQNSKHLTDLEKARELIEWVANRALSTNILAEQVNPYTNEPISVSPLTWSHATVVLTVLEYLESYSRINACPTCGRALTFNDVFNIKKEKHV